MYHEKNAFKRRFCSGAVLLVLVAICLIGARNARISVRAQGIDSTRQTVLRCAVQCYAVEGVYPATLEYLEEHYGLILDDKHYIVTYEAFSSNLLPNVSVLVRGDDT